MAASEENPQHLQASFQPLRADKFCAVGSRAWDGRVTGENGGKATHFQLKAGGPSHSIVGHIDTAERSNELIFRAQPGLADPSDSAYE